MRDQTLSFAHALHYGGCVRVQKPRGFSWISEARSIKRERGGGNPLNGFCEGQNESSLLWVTIIGGKRVKTGVSNKIAGNRVMAVK